MDVVTSNCVIDLAGAVQKVIAEAARVLKPGGRFAVSDVIADPDMDHRVHEHASSAIIRARKPSADGCCDTTALASCCEPETKDDCCGTTAGQPAAAAPSSCGCRT